MHIYETLITSFHLIIHFSLNRGLLYYHEITSFRTILPGCTILEVLKKKKIKKKSGAEAPLYYLQNQSSTLSIYCLSANRVIINFSPQIPTTVNTNPPTTYIVVLIIGTSKQLDNPTNNIKSPKNPRAPSTVAMIIHPMTILLSVDRFLFSFLLFIVYFLLSFIIV